MAAPESVIIRPWPKVVFLYPTFVVTTIFFLLSWLGVGVPENAEASPVLGNTFMLVLLLNLLVFSFDFSRIKSITIVIAIVAIVLLVLWIDTKADVTGFLGKLFGAIDIRVNTAFFGFLSAGLGFLLLVVFVIFAPKGIAGFLLARGWLPAEFLVRGWRQLVHVGADQKARTDRHAPAVGATLGDKP